MFPKLIHLALSGPFYPIVGFLSLTWSLSLFAFTSSIALVNTTTLAGYHAYVWIASVPQRWVQTRSLAGQPFMLKT